MNYRTLGNTQVSAVGLGCMGMSQSYGATDDKASLQALQHAVALGVTFLTLLKCMAPIGMKFCWVMR